MTRILPMEEYPRLAGTEAESVWPSLTDAARVVVVEKDGQIIGCHILQPVLHAECLWIHPDYRKRASVGRRLWQRVKETASQHFGVPWMATGCASDEVRRMLEHLGAVKLGDQYMVPVVPR